MDRDDESECRKRDISQTETLITTMQVYATFGSPSCEKGSVMSMRQMNWGGGGRTYLSVSVQQQTGHDVGGHDR